MPEVENPVEIGVLNYPGAQASAVHGLTDLFTAANRFSTELGRETGRQIRTSHWQVARRTGRIERAFVTPSGGTSRLDALIVPPSLEGRKAMQTGPKILTWVKKRHQDGAIVCSICAGAFVVAQAGLFQGRSVTTHWALEEQFSEAFPDIDLQTAKLIIEDGDIITAGGVMAWADLGLRLIDRFDGPSVMLAVARYFLVDPRGREQQFYSTFAPHLHHGDQAILKVQHWLQANFECPTSLAVMSGMANLSERTFLRRFRKATGRNPTAYLQQLRVGKARELLEFSSMPFNQISWKVGYEDASAFRKVFQKVMGLSPGDYKRRFAVN